MCSKLEPTNLEIGIIENMVTIVVSSNLESDHHVYAFRRDCFATARA